MHGENLRRVEQAAGMHGENLQCWLLPLPLPLPLLLLLQPPPPPPPLLLQLLLRPPPPLLLLLRPPPPLPPLLLLLLLLPPLQPHCQPETSTRVACLLHLRATVAADDYNTPQLCVSMFD